MTIVYNSVIGDEMNTAEAEEKSESLSRRRPYTSALLESILIRSGDEISLNMTFHAPEPCSSPLAASLMEVNIDAHPSL